MKNMPKKMILRTIIISSAIILFGISFQACDLFKKKEETKKADKKSEDNSAIIEKKLNEILERLGKIESGLSKLEEFHQSQEKNAHIETEIIKEHSDAKKTEEQQTSGPVEKQKEAVHEALAPEKAEKDIQKEKPKDAPDVIYKKAMAAYKSKKFEESASLFDEIIIFFPDNDLVDNSLYWKGESLLALKKYEEAILAFAKVAEKYPDSEKAASSLLKEGYSYAALGKMEEARNSYRKTVTTYPFSQPGAEAQSLLEKSE